MLALLWGLAGCLVSQPIVISYPPGASWTFSYHDALGEDLGKGKAEVSFARDHQLRLTFTESAFGDQASLKGRTGKKADSGWAPFSARGRWFDGRPFLFVGCIHRQKGRVAPGALALLQSRPGPSRAYPLYTDPCAGVATRSPRPPRFDEAQMDAVFSWSASAKASD